MTAPEPLAEPLLSAAGVRVDVDDATAIDRLDVVVPGPRLLVVGDGLALLAALTGVLAPRAPRATAPEVRVVAGSLSLRGRDVAARDHVLDMGAAPLDAPYPPDWTALEVVMAALRLGGRGGGRAAREAARVALERTGLGPAAGRAVRGLSVPERRALPLAAALARDVGVVVADRPLAGLDGPAAAFVLGAIGAATAGRAAVLSARAPVPGSPEGVLGDHATDLLVLAGGELAFVGAPSAIPAGARLWGLTVRANADALAAELERRGVTLSGGPLRFSVALPEGATTREVVAASVAARAPVVELVPLW